MTYSTHCALRLGDNLSHLCFLRALAKKHPASNFAHYAHGQYLPQLLDLTLDLPNLAVKAIQFAPPDSVDAWKNRGGFWQNSPLQNRFAEFYLSFFDRLALDMGLVSPLKTPDDLLFDYPLLKMEKPSSLDFLIINSPPQSGQLRGYDEAGMAALAQELVDRGYSVLTTHPVPNIACTQAHSYSVTAIGRLAQITKHIVMVATGPCWPTFSVWNKDTVQTRVILLDSEKIGLGPNEHHTQTVAGAREILTGRGLL